MNRDADIEAIIRRLNAIPALRDLREKHKDSPEDCWKANWALFSLANDAEVLLKELL